MSQMNMRSATDKKTAKRVIHDLSAFAAKNIRQQKAAKTAMKKN